MHLCRAIRGYQEHSPLATDEEQAEAERVARKFGDQ